MLRPNDDTNSHKIGRTLLKNSEFMPNQDLPKISKMYKKIDQNLQNTSDIVTYTNRPQTDQFQNFSVQFV